LEKDEQGSGGDPQWNKIVRGGEREDGGMGWTGIGGVTAMGHDNTGDGGLEDPSIEIGPFSPTSRGPRYIGGPIHAT
jgi:hypothetical protein